LSYQPQLKGPDIGGDLYSDKHVPGTVYYLAGFKADQSEGFGKPIEL
jgi:hypothetical protein